MFKCSNFFNLSILVFSFFSNSFFSDYNLLYWAIESFIDFSTAGAAVFLAGSAFFLGSSFFWVSSGFLGSGVVEVVGAIEF